MTLNKIIQTFPALKEGILLKRYKRFLADIELSSGEIVTAHCANTGPMTGVISIGSRVRLKNVESPNRKLAWSWEQSEVIDEKGISSWVGINTAIPNRIVRLAIQAGFLKKELGEISEIRNEVKYGENSRIDLLLTPKGTNGDMRKIFLEVKNTTWKKGSVALFPDTITTRGQKHLIEMINVLNSSRAVLVPCISRTDIKSFAPGDSADSKYGELFRLALKSGVEVIPCCFGFHKDKITWEGIKKIQEHEPS